MSNVEEEEDDVEEEDKEEDIKVILVGDPGTGKTSLINVSVGEKFKEASVSTLLSTFVQKKFQKDDKDYILNIWDTAGQEKYRAMTKIFIKNSKIVIFVYAINSKASFEGLQKFWFHSIKDALGEEPVYGIVGNKCDMFLKEEVKEAEGKQYAEENGMKFQLVSAKEDPNGFIDFLYSLFIDFLNKDTGPKRKTIFIDKDNGEEVKKKKKMLFQIIFF